MAVVILTNIRLPLKKLKLGLPHRQRRKKGIMALAPGTPYLAPCLEA